MRLGIWAFLAALNAAAVFWAARNLPASVASHFDLSGNPDGWMARESLVLLNVILLIVPNALFLALRSLSHDRKFLGIFNLPWRDHWLGTPERSDKGIALVQEILEVTAIFFNGAVLLTLWIILGENSADFVLPRVPVTPAVIAILASALGFAAWTVWRCKPSRS